MVSSTLDINFDLKGKDKVQAICNSLHGTIYVNPIGGINLYDKDDFKEKGIDLYFLQSDFEKIQYKQYNNPFIQGLSILDVLMFNSIDRTKELLQLYKVH